MLKRGLPGEVSPLSVLQCRYSAVFTGIMRSHPCPQIMSVVFASRVCSSWFWNEKKPGPGLTRRLGKRWSCSIRLLRNLLCLSSQASHQRKNLLVLAVPSSVPFSKRGIALFPLLKRSRPMLTRRLGIPLQKQNLLFTLKLAEVPGHVGRASIL